VSFFFLIKSLVAPFQCILNKQHFDYFSLKKEKEGRKEENKEKRKEGRKKRRHKRSLEHLVVPKSMKCLEKKK
jgi:hypothetical protein